MAEQEAIEACSRLKPGETVASALKRVLPELQSRRALAYGRVGKALRAHSAGTPNKTDGEYAFVCAHVTEDLKLASEGVMALRASLIPLRLPHAARAVAWIDSLQDLEERKLVATVSYHTLKRTPKKDFPLPIAHSSKECDKQETMEMKISRFAKELNSIDIEIRELFDEINEFIAEEQES